MDAIVRAVQPHEARVNVTYAGQNGDLPDPVSFDATDGDVKQWLTEAISNGGIPGIPEVQADLRDFVVDRFTATETRPYNLLQVRPKTPFGGEPTVRQAIMTLIHETKASKIPLEALLLMVKGEYLQNEYETDQ
jgi:hypothetical protein